MPFTTKIVKVLYSQPLFYSSTELVQNIYKLDRPLFLVAVPVFPFGVIGESLYLVDSKRPKDGYGQVGKPGYENSLELAHSFGDTARRLET